MNEAALYAGMTTLTIGAGETAANVRFTSISNSYWARYRCLMLDRRPRGLYSLSQAPREDTIVSDSTAETVADTTSKSRNTPFRNGLFDLVRRELAALAAPYMCIITYSSIGGGGAIEYCCRTLSSRPAGVEIHPLDMTLARSSAQRHPHS